MSVDSALFQITMNFTYSYIFDADNELLNGNITWQIPNFDDLSHWIHAEDVCKALANFGDFRLYYHH